MVWCVVCASPAPCAAAIHALWSVPITLRLHAWVLALVRFPALHCQVSIVKLPIISPPCQKSKAPVAPRTSQADLAAQPVTWGRSHLESAIPPARRRLFDLLAGRLNNMARELSLDWRRALGLQLWHGNDATDGVEQARLPHGL